MLGNQGRSKCELELCDNFTKWRLDKKKWSKFCCREHFYEYQKIHSGKYISLSNMDLYEKVLNEIANKELTTQSQLTKFINNKSPDNKTRDASRTAKRLSEDFKWIERERVFFNGRWTYNLYLTKKGKNWLSSKKNY